MHLLYSYSTVAKRTAARTARTGSGIAMKCRLDLDHDEVARRVRGALQEEGFGVLTEINVNGTLVKGGNR